MGIALFEDSHWQNFSPLTLTKATFDIKIGARTLFEEYPVAPDVLLVREYLAGMTVERHAQGKVNPSAIDTDLAFVNGLLHPGTISSERLSKMSQKFAIIAGDRLLVAKLDKKGAEYLSACVLTGKKIEV